MKTKKEEPINQESTEKPHSVWVWDRHFDHQECLGSFVEFEKAFDIAENLQMLFRVGGNAARYEVDIICDHNHEE